MAEKDKNREKETNTNDLKWIVALLACLTLPLKADK